MNPKHLFVAVPAALFVLSSERQTQDRASTKRVPSPA